MSLKSFKKMWIRQNPKVNYRIKIAAQMKFTDKLFNETERIYKEAVQQELERVGFNAVTKTDDLILCLSQYLCSKVKEE